MTLSSKRRIIQILEYLVGGGVYFWSGYLIFAVAYSGLQWTWWQAKILADIVGWTLNYFVQRYWAFASPELKSHEGLNRFKYGILAVFNFALDYAIVGGLQAVGVSPYIGKFVSAGFFTFWNYFWFRWWIFRGSNG